MSINSLPIYPNKNLMTTNMYEEIDVNYMQTADSDQVTFIHQPLRSKIHPQTQYKQFVWKRLVIFTILHTIAIYGFYLEICGYVQKKTIIFGEYKITALIRRSVNHASLNFRFFTSNWLGILQFV